MDEYSNEMSEVQNSKKKVILIIAVIAILTIIAILSIYFFSIKDSKMGVKDAGQPEAQDDPPSSSTESASIDVPSGMPTNICGKCINCKSGEEQSYSYGDPGSLKISCFDCTGDDDCIADHRCLDARCIENVSIFPPTLPGIYNN